MGFWKIFTDKNRRNTVWKKLNFKYRISATNENTLEEIWRFRTSMLWGALIFVIFAVMLVVGTSALIITTPIRNYLPGYLDVEIRDKALQSAMEIEQMEQKVTMQETYLENLRSVFAGERELDYVRMQDSITVSETDPKLMKSKKEKNYVENYMEEEMYNLSVLINEADLPMSGTAFYKPVKGVVIEGFNVHKGHYGVKVSVGQKETILSALEGTVIFAGYSAADGHVVQVQHGNGFVSVYKHNSMLLVGVGTAVKTGTAIAVKDIDKKDKFEVEKGKEEDVSFVSFELWYKGKPVDPQNYFYF